MSLDDSIDLKRFVEHLINKNKTRKIGMSFVMYLHGHNVEDIAHRLGIHKWSVSKNIAKIPHLFKKFSCEQ